MWDDLSGQYATSRARKIADLFDDTARGAEFAISADELFFDYSKTNIDRATRDSLIALAHKQNIAERRDQMFAGEKINTTEGRAVLHTALRNLDGGAVHVDGADVMPGVLDVLDKMSDFADAVRSGRFAGAGGKITDVVNIGIGGSDLGPAMAVLALAPYADGPKCHFISNVDGADLADTLAPLDPKTTLVLVASKTFTTLETMMNAQSALDWMAKEVADPAAQFAAISTAMKETADFGIPAERVFGFEDWVGGRYSMWGPIGLSIMLAVGPENFRDFLRGGQAMDRHFCTADLSQNMPVMLALVGIWHHQVCGYGTRAVLPYEQRLLRLPAYLQQLEMESNGKSVSAKGEELDQPVGPIVWGEPGTNGQHAFYQLIHQGKQVVPCEFMVGAEGHEAELAHHHRALLANCLAQSEALMLGRDLDRARIMMAEKGLTGAELEANAMQRVFSGNRPSTTLIYKKLTPFVLGQIIALYEHRVFVEGTILGINPYDQWGVELGKELAQKLAPAVEEGGDTTDLHAATARLVEVAKSMRGDG
ncbi:glucose-6-phosphate isomerase [Cognatishimia sp. SS12]|uniref:glucose-6-phosphate isomerase n=1 Tax=Cognatishimia sp. SS12 TaxID=2979465 RepID=UPI00232A8196|nr:glucose-6-phosphate isomerase [Cognatishimia sp. SS12]MDC0737169.1 glucose-6-phosphate isomerase [Cognatishimia sp. SS12]